MRNSDTLAALIAIVSAIICYIENVNFYNQVIDDDGNITKPSNQSTTTGNILRGVIIVLTIILCKSQLSSLIYSEIASFNPRYFGLSPLQLETQTSQSEKIKTRRR